jgi:RHS repeat-associated protein
LAAEYETVAQSADCTTCYLTTDPLGSTRVITDGNGNVVSRHDYYPFGEELATSNRTSALQYGVTDYVAQRFTSKERDSETGLDWFATRYMSSAQGRFTSPDPLGAGAGREGDPQSWNMYAYARNNPLVYTDPLGLSYEICGNDGKDCGVYSDDQYAKLRKDKSFIIANGTIYARNKNGTQGDALGTVKDQGRDLDDRGQQPSVPISMRHLPR